jgi:4-azaleucine resistance transporter AzlC
MSATATFDGTASPRTESTLRDGVKAGLPFVFPTFALAVSFGVLAEPLMGQIAPIVMSIVVFSGAAQFAGLSVLLAGGGIGPAVAAGLLMNARYLPMGFAFGPSLRGGRFKRAVQGQAVVDASWAISSRGDGTFDRFILFGATIPQATAWISGTAVGVFGGDFLGDPMKLGLDAIFPAFYLVLLMEEAKHGSAIAAAILGGAITLVLMPFAPAGVPVVAASAAALLGLWRRDKNGEGEETS